MLQSRGKQTAAQAAGQPHKVDTEVDSHKTAVEFGVTQRGRTTLGGLGTML